MPIGRIRSWFCNLRNPIGVVYTTAVGGKFALRTLSPCWINRSSYIRVGGLVLFPAHGVCDKAAVCFLANQAQWKWHERRPGAPTDALLLVAVLESDSAMGSGRD